MLELVPLRARPDLRAQVFGKTFMALWPTFVVKDPTADLFFEQPHFDACLDTAFAVVESARPNEAVGRAFAVPFAFGIPGREELSDSGWDGVVRWAHEDRALGRAADALSALEITLLPSHRGRGAARVVLDAMRRRALGAIRAHAGVRGPLGRGRAAYRSVATRAHSGGREDREGRADQHGGPRHDRRLAALDGD